MTNNNGEGNVSRFGEFAAYSFISIILVTMAIAGAASSYFLVTWALGIR